MSRLDKRVCPTKLRMNGMMHHGRIVFDLRVATCDARTDGAMKYTRYQGKSTNLLSKARVPPKLTQASSSSESSEEGEQEEARTSLRRLELQHKQPLTFSIVPG